MKTDEDFEQFNDFSSLSDVHIDNEEESKSSIGTLTCDQNPKQFFLPESKQTLLFFSFILLISIFIPSKLHPTEITHQFDSKHYPNYTIFAQIKNLPKNSIHGFFVSIKFLNFKEYIYEPKHDNKLAHFHRDKLKKSFLFNGNINIELLDLSSSAINSNIIYNADFEHRFLISHKCELSKFQFATHTDEFILFSDKLPSYDTFSINMTANARHPRAENLILKFYYCSTIFEIFDTFVRLSLIICIISTTPHFFYSKLVLTQIKLFFNSNLQIPNNSELTKLNIQHVLTFILRIFTIFYILIPIISGSMNSISFFQIPHFSFIINFNIIIRDLFFSYILFYIISILRMTEKETDLSSKYLIQGSKEDEKIVFDECFDNKLSFLIWPFMIFSPFLILMIINDCESDFSHSRIKSTQNITSLFDLISISPKGYFIFRSLESINYNHFFLFLVFLFFLISTFFKLKRILQRKNMKSNGNYFEYIKNRYDNYFMIIIPFALFFYVIVFKNVVILTWIYTKSGIIKLANDKNEKKTPLLNLTTKIVEYSSKKFDDDGELSIKSSYINSFLFLLVRLLSFNRKTALFSTFSILFPSLFTIAMSILHTPSKLFSE